MKQKALNGQFLMRSSGRVISPKRQEKYQMSDCKRYLQELAGFLAYQPTSRKHTSIKIPNTILFYNLEEKLAFCQIRKSRLPTK